MKIQFLKQWKHFKAETVTEIADGVANVLIRRGLARECAATENRPARQTETAAASPPETTCQRPAKPPARQRATKHHGRAAEEV